MNILIIAAHPDDEVLGCGGTIARHIANGDNVKVVTLADGEQSRSGANNSNRDSYLKKSCDILGVQSFSSHNFKDNQLDSYPLLEIVKIIENEVNRFSPQVIYTHSQCDLNVDHQIVNKAVMTCCRPQSHCPVRKILAFEIPSSTQWQSPEVKNFIPDYFIDITNYSVKKLEALKIYDKEMRAFPHPRSYKAIDALEILRGATVGLERAEAFKVLRIID